MNEHKAKNKELIQALDRLKDRHIDLSVSYDEGFDVMEDAAFQQADQLLRGKYSKKVKREQRIVRKLKAKARARNNHMGEVSQDEEAWEKINEIDEQIFQLLDELEGL